MSTRVQLPAALREYVAGAAEVEVHATSVASALAELSARHPVLRRHLFDDAEEAFRTFFGLVARDIQTRLLALTGRKS